VLPSTMEIAVDVTEGRESKEQEQEQETERWKWTSKVEVKAQRVCAPNLPKYRVTCLIS
jgi:hypothetical protein